jgi:hypothetical protein
MWTIITVILVFLLLVTWEGITLRIFKRRLFLEMDRRLGEFTQTHQEAESGKSGVYVMDEREQASVEQEQRCASRQRAQARVVRLGQVQGGGYLA